MTQWHVSKAGQQLAPMTETDLLAAIRSGEISGQDMVWADGMANWQKVAEVPALAAALPGAGPMLGTASAGQGSLGVMNYQMPQSGPIQCTETAIQSLKSTKPWARLMGVSFIVIGALSGLAGLFAMLGGAFGGRMVAMMAVVYLLMTAIYVMLGVYLNRYASKIGALLAYRREDYLESALDAQQKFWRLAGIILLTVIGLYVLIIVIALVVGVAMR